MNTADLSSCETLASRAVRVAKTTIEEWWKYTATGACAVLVTVAVGYATGAAQWITRDDAVKLINDQSPYIKDRDRLTTELTFIKQTLLELRVDQRDTIGELREDNRRLREQVQSLEVQVTRMTNLQK